MLTNGPNMYQRARKESCLTQEQAAEQLCVSETTMKAWEQGARVPDNETVARMAELYEAPWLLLEHALTSGGALGVLPAGITIQGLPTAVLTLINRATALADDYRRLMMIAEDGVIDEAERPDFSEISANIQGVIAAGFQVLYAQEPDKKKERPEAATSKRSGSETYVTTDCRNYYSTSARKRKSHFGRRGGASL